MDSNILVAAAILAAENNRFQSEIARSATGRVSADPKNTLADQFKYFVHQVSAVANGG